MVFNPENAMLKLKRWHNVVALELDHHSAPGSTTHQLHELVCDVVSPL